jgi:hypothetical protein
LLSTQTKDARLGSFRLCLRNTDLTAQVSPTRVSILGPFHAAHAIAFCLRSIVFSFIYLSDTARCIVSLLYFRSDYL